MIRITDIRMPLLACTVALAGAALAGDPTPGEAAFAAADTTPTDSKLDKAEFTTTLEEGASEKKINKSFKKADRNKDESITLDEYLIFVGEKKPPTKQEAAFAAADISPTDGILSQAEYITAFQGKGSFIAAKKKFLLADKAESEAGLTFEEFTAKKVKAKKGEYLSFDLADTELPTGELTLAEFTQTFPKAAKAEKVQAKFAKLDKDESGELTKSEWNPGAPKTPAP